MKTSEEIRELLESALEAPGFEDLLFDFIAREIVVRRPVQHECDVPKGDSDCSTSERPPAVPQPLSRRRRPLTDEEWVRAFAYHTRDGSKKAVPVNTRFHSRLLDFLNFYVGYMDFEHEQKIALGDVYLGNG